MITMFADEAANVTGDAVVGGVLLLFIFFGLILLAFAALFVFWIITLVHAISHEDVPDRVLWIVLHFVVGAIMGPIYWFAVKRPYDEKHRPVAK